MTWRYLLARLVGLFRLWRARFRLCEECQAPLLPDEMGLCSECVAAGAKLKPGAIVEMPIGLTPAAFSEVLKNVYKPTATIMDLQSAASVQQKAARALASCPPSGLHGLFRPAVVGLPAPSLQGLPMTPEEWERFDREVS